MHIRNRTTDYLLGPCSWKFSELKRNTGRQAYSVPASVDAEGYTEVWVWCERFNVPLGVA